MKPIVGVPIVSETCPGCGLPLTSIEREALRLGGSVFHLCRTRGDKRLYVIKRVKRAGP